MKYIVLPRFDCTALTVDITDLDTTKGAHPNAIPFSGVLLKLDEPSQQPPHGSDGHLIQVSTATAERTVSTLPGMAVNYRPDGHAPQEKIGVISRARVEAGAVKVWGLLYAKDFPDEVQEIRANAPRLGMSMELSNITVQEDDADPKVWHLEDFFFTGAAILAKKAAAYHTTSLAASASKLHHNSLAASAAKKEDSMKGKGKVAASQKPTTGQALITAMAAAVGIAVREPFEQLGNKIDGLQSVIKAALKPSASSPSELQDPSDAVGRKGAASPSPSAPSPSEEVLAGTDAEAVAAANEVDGLLNAANVAGKKVAARGEVDPSEEEGEEPSPGDEDYLDAGVAASPSDADQQPGKVNKNADERYKKHSTAHLHAAAERKTIGELSAALDEERGKRRTLKGQYREIHAAHETLKKETTDLKKKVSNLEAQAEKFANQVERRSLPPHLTNLLTKAGFSISEMKASGEKLTVNQVDTMLAQSGVTLDVTARAHFKNMLVEAGLMDEGVTDRVQ